MSPVRTLGFLCSCLLAEASEECVIEVSPVHATSMLARSSHRTTTMQGLNDQRGTSKIAMQWLSLLRAEGKNDTSCHEVAEAIQSSIKVAIEALQATLDAADNGTSCANEMKEEYDALGKEMRAAYKEQDRATSLYFPLTWEKVTWTYSVPEVPLDDAALASLVRDHLPYKAAKLALQAAKDAKEAAEAAARAAQKAGDDSIPVRAQAIKACRCRVQATHEEEFAAATKNEANVTAEWTKAAHLLCTLDGIPHENCSVPEVPVVKQPALPDIVRTAVCAAPTGSKGGKGGKGGNAS